MCYIQRKPHSCSPLESSFDPAIGHWMNIGRRVLEDTHKFYILRHSGCQIQSMIASGLRINGSLYPKSNGGIQSAIKCRKSGNGQISVRWTGSREFCQIIDTGIWCRKGRSVTGAVNRSFQHNGIIARIILQRDKLFDFDSSRIRTSKVQLSI